MGALSAWASYMASDRRRTNVGKLAVLEEEDVVLLAEPDELLDEVGVKIGNDVDVRLCAASTSRRTAH
jgi:hypothetical protein